MFVLKVQNSKLQHLPSPCHTAPGRCSGASSGGSERTPPAVIVQLRPRGGDDSAPVRQARGAEDPSALARRVFECRQGPSSSRGGGGGDTGGPVGRRPVARAPSHGRLFLQVGYAVQYLVC